MKNFLILCLLCSLAFAVENPSVDSALVKTAQDSLIQKDSLVVADTLSAKIPTDSLSGMVKVDSVAKSEVQEELALRDSLLAVGDSIREAEQKLHQSELEVENARCENWEKSYSTLKQEYETCVKILRVNLTNGEAKQKQMRRMGTIDQMGSWVGGILIGLALGIWVF